jgi:exo-1,4-beta-D-glucosaminidase
MEIIVDGGVSDKQNIKFGIRDVQDYYTENGYRGFKINGKKLVIKGAGWVDDLFLNDSDEKVISQVEYAKHMNLNTIRLEGFWGKNQTLYNAADENGILLMIGWSCQWEWESYCGRKESEFMSIDTPRDIELQSTAYIDQVKWLRNHPSIFLWVLGSDKLPNPELETKMNNLLKIFDPTRPILSSCKGMSSEGEEIY